MDEPKKLTEVQQELVVNAHRAGFVLSDDFLVGMAFCLVGNLSLEDYEECRLQARTEATYPEFISAVTGHGFLRLKQTAIELNLPVEIGDSIHASTTYKPRSAN